MLVRGVVCVFAESRHRCMALIGVDFGYYVFHWYESMVMLPMTAAGYVCLIIEFNKLPYCDNITQ